MLVSISVQQQQQSIQSSGMDFVHISHDRFDDVVLHLQHAFFRDEPLNKSVDLFADECGNRLTEKYCLKTLNEELSLMAVTPDQEVGYIWLKYFVRNLFLM